jgi:hypothetical protein
VPNGKPLELMEVLLVKDIVTFLLLAVPSQVKVLVLAAALYTNEEVTVSVYHEVSRILAIIKDVEVEEAVTVSFLQFSRNKMPDNKIAISEIFFIYDYLAKERLLAKFNIKYFVFYIF